MVANLSSVTAFLERLLVALREGAVLLETDMRAGAIAALVLCIGLVLGAFLQSVLHRRGRIAEMRKDLDRIARLQQSILNSLSRQPWTHQDLAILKRETYQKLNRALGALSSDLASILRHDTVRNGSASDSDSEIDPPTRKALEKRLDEFADLVIPAHISVSRASLDIVMRFQSESEQLRQLTGGVSNYGFFGDLQRLVDDARTQLLESAGTDLRAAALDPEKRRAV